MLTVAALAVAPACGTHEQGATPVSELAAAEAAPGTATETATDPAATSRARSQDASAVVSAEDLLTPSLVCDQAALVPGGDATLGLTLVLEPGWHTYGLAANDSGFAPQLQFDLPEGIQVGETGWPVPERHVSPGDLLDHVYHHEVTLLLPLSVAADVPPGEVTLELAFEFLVCETICLMGEHRLSLTLPVLAAGTTPQPGAGREAIAASRARLAGPPPPALQLTLDARHVDLRLPGARGLTFIPSPDCLPFDDLLSQGRAEGDRLQLTRATRGGGGERLRGTLVVDADAGHPARAYTIASPPVADDG